MTFSFFSSLWSINSLTFSRESISSSIFIASSLAPPCNGPLKLPTAAVKQECKSDNVDAHTLPVNVDALNSCSAYKVNETSNVLLWRSFISSCLNNLRKCAATETSSEVCSILIPS